MSNLTITTDFGTLTLTTSLGNVQDAMDGRHPTDLGRPDLRTFFESDLRWLKHYGFVPLARPNVAFGLSG